VAGLGYDVRMRSIALSCEGLVKRYDEVVAVDGLSLDVARGECFGLLGPNGAGKTTTVEMFEGLLVPDAGSLQVLGLTWREGGRKLRERLGIQLQETRLPEKLTVLETLTLFRSFYTRGTPPREVLGLVGLEEKAKARVRALSGGQHQRLSLACALICEPEVLFLDEPTTGLDPQSRRMTWGVIEEFRRGGGTVLLTTHYMEEAERLCDRVAIVDHGRLIALGSPAELIASLGAEHLVEFEVESDADPQSFAALVGVRAVSREQDAIRLTVQEVHRTVPALLAELSRRGIELTRLTTHHATLEDVFVAHTGRHLRDE
jgi:ABC-2 type transport system ATP-binding protein